MTDSNDLATIKRLLLMADREGYAIVMAKAHAAIEKLEADNARLRKALQLAANRLERNAVDYIAAGDPHSYEQSEWADEARRAALQETSHDA